MTETLQHSFAPEDERFLNGLDQQMLQGQEADNSSIVESFNRIISHFYRDSVPEPDYILEEPRLQEKETKPSRAERLASLPHEGLTDQEHQRIVDQLDAILRNIEPITSLVKRPNDETTKNVLASYTTGGENKGQLAVYEKADQLPPEAFTGALSHENGHADSPFDPAHDEVHGGEPERKEAAAFAINLAQQSLETNTFMNGYQKMLAQELAESQEPAEKEEKRKIYYEETYAIAIELGLTNPAKLEQVQAAQQAKIAKRQKAGTWPDDIQPVNLVSTPGPDGEIVVDGIDKTLIRLLEGIDSHEALVAHRENLKTKFYPEQSRAIAQKRAERRKSDKAVSTQQAQTVGRRAMSHLFVPDAVQFN